MQKEADLMGGYEPNTNDPLTAENAEQRGYKILGTVTDPDQASPAELWDQRNMIDEYELRGIDARIVPTGEFGVKVLVIKENKPTLRNLGRSPESADQQSA